MRLSRRWLADYIDLDDLDDQTIRRALFELGHEVEGVERHDVGWTGVRVAEVLTVEPHPDADRIRVCTVSTGGEPITVVCGAWNFEAGARVAFAEPGAVLPGDFRLGTRDIRGVTSNGMICSERELRLGDDHAGILVLDGDSPVGSRFEDVVELPDTVFDLSITPNRPDAMSVVGIARDLSAYFGRSYRRPPTEYATIDGEPSVGVHIEDPTGCLRFTIREIRGAAIGPSPFWLRHRLRRAGVRPISNAVDVTNYVMLELGHPLHVFDRDRVVGRSLVVRRARDGETIVTLDDVERSLTPDDLVIVDDDGPTSLAGTMGGARSEVSEGTDDILLEAATWDPPTIMEMSRRHGLRSEASARFERGVDPELPAEASARAARLLAETSGGAVVAGLVDEVAVPHRRTRIELLPETVTRLLGPGFDRETIARHLRSIELEVEDIGIDADHDGSGLEVTVPGFRPDLTRPVDLVEEVARLHGYGRFGESVPTGVSGGWTIEQRRTHRIGDALVAAGLREAIHLSFIAEADLDAFGFPPDADARAVVRVRNPLREEEALLRTTLLPGLLNRIRVNRSHGIPRVALFEIGRVFFARPSSVDSRIPDQPMRVAWAVVGGLSDPGIDEPPEVIDGRTSTALLRSMTGVLGLAPTIVQAEHPGFHPGRCARVEIDGVAVGVVGEIHPETSSAYGIGDRVAAGELDLARLVETAPERRFRPPSSFPSTEFDLAFLLDPDRPAAALLEATGQAAGDLLESAFVFDEYRGVDGDGRSVAIRFVLRAPDRTLTAEDLAPVRQAMIEAGTSAGGVLRGTR